MKVFVTGATGFVGQEVIKTLEQDNLQVRILLREKSQSDEYPNTETVIGDTTRPDT